MKKKRYSENSFLKYGNIDKSEDYSIEVVTRSLVYSTIKNTFLSL